MQIPAGPNQVAQAYQGNPAALQANIQKDQQQKPNLGPDLVKLLALGTVTSEKDNASKAQALQQLQGLMAQSPTGKPPTVFEQIQRKAAQMTMGLGQAAQPQPESQGLPAALQEQGQEQAQPEQAQGIDQLPAEFEFAGGGIVAFNGTEGSFVVDPMTGTTAPSNELDGDDRTILERLGIFNPENRRALEKMERRIAESKAGEKEPTKTEAAPAAPPKLLEETAESRPVKTSAPAAPKPAPAATAPAAPQQGIKQLAEPAEPVDPMEAALSKSIISYLGQKPEDVYKEGVQRNRATVGLDALLQEKEGRIASTEALLKKQQAGRLPLWVTQLQEFSAANPRAGLGAQLGASGAGAAKARAGYEAEDRAYNAEINKLRDSVLQAKIEGRYKDAAAGEAAIKDLTANRRQAESSGTSLLNTQANIKSTAESKRQHEERMRAEAGARAAENKRQFELKLEHDKNKHRDRMENFIKEQERKYEQFTLSSPEYKGLVDREKSLQYLLISSNQKVRENAEAELQRISEKKAELLAKKAGEASAEAPKTTKAPKASATTGQDKDAVAWAKANPNDPRAAKILELNK
jgi:hypothetical protein